MGVPRFAWLLAALVVGTVAMCDPGGWSPFGPAKWLVVSVLGCLLIAGAIVRRRTLSLVERMLIGSFVAMVVLAAIAGVDGRSAWLGTPERHLGVATWMIVVACYVAGRALDVDERSVVVRAAVLAGGVVGGWAVVELASRPPIELASTTDRLTGPFGSAAYLGAASLLFGFVSAGVALERSERVWWRGVAAFGALGCAVALVGSGTRAAWLGAFVGAVLLARRHLRWVLVALGVAFVVSLPRLGDVLDRSVGADSRLDEWRVAARVIGAHPVLGVGPEGYRIAFAEGVDDAYEREYGRDVLPDRAHSAPLDVALIAGIPASMVWTVGVAIVVRRGVGSARAGSPVVAGLGAACVAFFVQQLLLFPTMELDPIAWAFAGMLVTATGRRSARPSARPAGRVLTGLAVASAVVAGVAGVRALAADRFARSALDALAAGDPAVADARQAVELRGDAVRYRLLLARAEEADGTLASVGRAIASVDAAREVSPRDPIVRGEHARLVSVRAGITGDASDQSAAFAAYRSLVADDPHRATWQFGLGRAAAAIGDLSTAQAALERAVFLDPTDLVAAAALDRVRAEVGG